MLTRPRAAKGAELGEDTLFKPEAKRNVVSMGRGTPQQKRWEKDGLKEGGSIMARCASYFPSSACSNCSGSSSGDCNCGYIIERYDPRHARWVVLEKRCTGTGKPPPETSQGLSGTQPAYAGMCRLRCCVPDLHVASSGKRVLWYAAAAVGIALLIYFLYRLIF